MSRFSRQDSFVVHLLPLLKHKPLKRRRCQAAEKKGCLLWETEVVVEDDRRREVTAWMLQTEILAGAGKRDPDPCHGGGLKLGPIRISPIKLVTFGGTWPGPRGTLQKDIWNLCLSYSFDFQLGGVYKHFNHITSPS